MRCGRCGVLTGVDGCEESIDIILVPFDIQVICEPGRKFSGFMVDVGWVCRSHGASVERVVEGASEVEDPHIARREIVAKHVIVFKGLDLAPCRLWAAT